MRISLTLVLLVNLLGPGVLAAEPDIDGAVTDHVLGRVFMNSDERRRLDAIRRSPPRAEATAMPTGNATPDTPGPSRKTVPVGFFVTSGGVPYQWVDGDFLRVAPGSVQAADRSASIRITRHKANPGEDSAAQAVPASEPSRRERPNVPDTDDAIQELQ